jgi:hypothetical protein
VTSRVRERLLSDAVGRDRDPGRDGRQVSAHPEVHREPPSPRLIDEGGDLGHRWERRFDPALAVAAEQRQRASKLLHAPSTDLFGRSQRILGRRGIPAKDVPGARHLEHDGGQPVADEVVDVTCDFAPFGHERLLRQLTLGVLELFREPLLANDDPRYRPGEGDPHDPDRDGHLRWVLNQRHQHRSGRREQAERDRAPERLRPESDDEAQERRLEHQRLELSGALHDHHRDDHADGQPEEGRSGCECPDGERDDRHRREEQIGDGRGLREHRDEGDRERRDRNHAA